MLEKQAKTFAQLHKKKEMFVLPNVWNAGSAVVFEKQGFKAVATTSAGIAYALGYPDGEYITMDDLCLAVKQITNRISIPLSVDFERGYGESPKEIKENAKRLLDVGAVGFNIEDGLPDGTLENLSTQLSKIGALVELKDELGLPFVINARTCAYWLNIDEGISRLNLVIERANEFARVGADCVFIPGLMDEQTVVQLVNRINSPVNIIANPIFNNFKQMNNIGVRRLSIGSGAVRSVFNHLINIGKELYAGEINTLTTHRFSYGGANEYFRD